MARFLFLLATLFLYVSAQKEESIRPEVLELAKQQLESIALQRALEDSTFTELNQQLARLTKDDIKQLIREVNEESVAGCINHFCKYSWCEGLSLCMKLQAIRYKDWHLGCWCRESFLEELATECELTEELKHQLDKEYNFDLGTGLAIGAIIIFVIVFLTTHEKDRLAQRDELMSKLNQKEEKETDEEEWEEEVEEKEEESVRKRTRSQTKEE